MNVGPSIVGIAALIGDHARAQMLTAMMAGQALTPTELAQCTGVTKQTVSAHLAKLLDAQLIAVEQQGRHRYFRLADRDVAQLLEQLMGVAYRSGAVPLRASRCEPALRHARVCYDHLAGDLGVAVFDGMLQRRWLRPGPEGPALTRPGHAGIAAMGIDINALAHQRRPLCRACLDWSARRHHLAGGLGAALLRRYLELGWARRARDSRVVNFTPAGEHALRAHFSIVAQY